MKKWILMLILPTFIYSGCTDTQQGAGGGALLGAAAGAIIGNQHSSSHRDKGVLIGAAVGALAGTAIGQASDMKKAQSGGGASEQVIAICPSCDSRVDVSDFPAGSTVQCPNCRSQFKF